MSLLLLILVLLTDVITEIIKDGFIYDVLYVNDLVFIYEIVVNL